MSSLVVTAPRAHPDQMTVVAEEQHGLSNVALSADGKQVAFMQLVTLFVDKAEGGDPRIVAGEPEGTVMSMGARVSF